MTRLASARTEGRDAPFEELLAAPEWAPFVALLRRLWRLEPTEAPGAVAALDAAAAAGVPRWSLLREWHRLVGARRELVWVGDCSELELMPAGQLEPEDDHLDGGGYVTVLQDASGTAWVVSLADRGLLDPPVLRLGQDEELADAQLACGSLARFLRSAALFSLVYGACSFLDYVPCPPGAGLAWAGTADGVRRLAAAYPPLEAFGGPVGGAPWDEVRGDDATVIVGAGDMAFAMTFTAEAWQKLHPLVPAWSMSSAPG